MRVRLVYLVMIFCFGSASMRADIVSDVLTVRNATGVIVGQVGVTEGGVVFGLNSATSNPTSNGVFEDPSAFYYINDPTVADPTQAGNPLNLVEPDNTLSDVVGVGTVGADFFLGFSSDLESFGFNVGFGDVFLETGQPIDITAFLDPVFRDWATPRVSNPVKFRSRQVERSC